MTRRGSFEMACLTMLWSGLLSAAAPVTQPGHTDAGNEMQRIMAAASHAPPLEQVAIRDRDMTLVAEAVQTWRGGNRLTLEKQPQRSLLPGSYAKAALQIRTEAGEEARPEDIAVDETWGAFALTPESRLKAGQKVRVSYAYSLRRVDALVSDEAGGLSVVPGTASADCSALPVIPKDARHVANIYRPFNAKACRPEHVYLVHDEKPDLSAKPPGAALAAVIRKLETGEAVTVVCWGDSVTVGGDAGPPGSEYVSLFETRLKERFPKARIRVINAGIGGTSMPGRLPSIEKEVLAHRPDVVTLEFVNDMGLSPAQLKDLYAKMLAQVRRAGSALIIITPHFTMPSWMPLPTGRGADPRPAVAFLRSFAKENDVPVADASLRWEQLERIGIPYEIYLRNGINHPDERGHVIFAEELMRLFGAFDDHSR